MNKKNIPFFDYKKLYSSHKKDLDKIFSDTASKGKFILQNDLINFEKKLSKKLDCYVVGVNNATDAMQLFLKASEIKKNTDILISSHTMIATASAIKFVGCNPVPVDIGEDHLMCPRSLEKNITKKTSAIMPTQLNGRVCDMEKISKIAKQNNLLLFEDSAQALGAKFKNKFAGTFGLAGCISFYPAKTLGCFGDGGAVLTKSKNIYKKVKKMRDHGRSNSFDVDLWGYNSRLDNIQAAFLNYFLKKYDSTIIKRRKLAKIYFQKLCNNRYLTLPPKPCDHKDNYDIFQNFEIRANKRDLLRDFLKKNKIGTIIQWGGYAIHDFKKLGFKKKLSFTEMVMNSSLMLPMNQFLSEQDVIYVCDKINEFYEKY